MLRFLGNYSIGKKLILLVSATAGLCIIIILSISSINDAISARAAEYRQLKVLVEVVARNSAPAILFDDVAAANEALSVLQINNSVLHAEIKHSNQKVFASYTNVHHSTHTLAKLFPELATIIIEQPIIQNGKVEGSLRLVADYDDVWGSLTSKWFVDLIGLAIAFVLGYWLMQRLIKSILKPIERLAGAAREIINHKEYSLRVEKTTEDELGSLTDDFNLMLAQIELRDGQLRQSGEALAQTKEAILLRDENLCCIYVNPAFTALFGDHLEEMVGKPFTMGQQSTTEAELSQEEIYRIARENGSYRGEVVRQAKSGKLIPISLQVSPILDEAGKLTGYVSISSDISEKKHQEEWIWRQANFDQLTGLPNRHMFHERLQQEILRTQRTGAPFALMFLDLDNFKEVNDSLGHDVGDILLKQAAERLVSCVRNTDAVGYVDNVARLGGDEFTIILNNFKDISNIDAIVQRILQKLAEPFQLGTESANVSASIGITLCPQDAIEAEALIKNADQTMYDAKSKGRNTYSYFTREMQLAAQKRRQMVADLREAIDKKQFLVVYQPIVDMKANQILKAEALIRWQHPTYGMVSPMEFIPVAEETGMIVEIGDWVFFEVTNQLAKWRKSIHKNFQVSINKSPVQFHDKRNSHDAWFEHLRALGLPGESLAVEITEGLMLDKDSAVSDKLLAFRDAGVQVAVDDFGTGYSSLSYLKKLDIDYIKIDKSFVQNLSSYSEDMVLCEAIIVMAHKLSLKVVAEGIETTEQRDLLVAVGCDYGQGYLFSRPVPADDLEALAISQNKSVMLVPTAEGLLENLQLAGE
jgi:diguanylate cyclase (GGDEF)-like protein/PAS domain S-box-containing protein